MKTIRGVNFSAEKMGTMDLAVGSMQRPEDMEGITSAEASITTNVSEVLRQIVLSQKTEELYGNLTTNGRIP